MTAAEEWASVTPWARTAAFEALHDQANRHDKRAEFFGIRGCDEWEERHRYQAYALRAAIAVLEEAGREGDDQ